MRILKSLGLTLAIVVTLLAGLILSPFLAGVAMFVAACAAIYLIFAAIHDSTLE